MSRALDSKWDDIRRKFSSDLYKPCAEKNNFHTFTACADLDSTDNLCHIAKCLVGPVKYLKKKTNFQWLTVVQYDLNALTLDDVHRKHLSFYVSENLENLFHEESKRMFLMTGVACGLDFYRPSEIDTLATTSSFPMFELHYTKKNTILSKDKDHIVFEISADKNACCKKIKVSCESCTATSSSIKVFVPDVWKTYVAGIHKLNEDERKLLLRTLYNFIFKYPCGSSQKNWPKEYSALFLPGVHVPNLPYYLNGVLISFNNAVKKEHLEIIKKWTADVCQTLAGAVTFHNKGELHAPWIFGVGTASKNYFSDYCLGFKEGGGIAAQISNSESEPLYKAELPKPFHNDSLLTKLSGDQPILLQREDIKCFKMFNERLSSWIMRFGDFSVDTKWRAAIAYMVFTKLKDDKIHLLALLAFCKDVGFKPIDISADVLALVNKNFPIWEVEEKITAHFVLRTLIYDLATKYKDSTRSVSVKLEDNESICFNLNIELPLGEEKSEEDQSEKKIYVNWMQEKKMDHLLTQTILAAEQLGKNGPSSKPGYLDVRPVWGDTNNKEINKLVQQWESHNTDGALVVLEKAKARIIVKKTWCKKRS